MKRTALVISGVLLAVTAPSLCSWLNNCFDDHDHCEDEACGYGCDIFLLGPDQKVCYSPGSGQCCLCFYRYDQCDCLFGSGWARETSKFTVNGTTCNGEGCGDNCPGFTPPPLPLPE